MLRLTPQSTTTTWRRGSAGGFPGRPSVHGYGGAAGDFLDEVHADDPRRGGELSLQGRPVEVRGGDDAVLGALHAEVTGQRPRVDALDPDDALFREPRVQVRGGAPVRAEAADFPDDESRQPGPGGFPVFGNDAVVPDQGIGHGDDLAAVGGIRENFLVPADGRVENDLAERLSAGAEALPRQLEPVIKKQYGFSHDSPHRSGAAPHCQDDGQCAYTWRTRTWTARPPSVSPSTRIPATSLPRTLPRSSWRSCCSSRSAGSRSSCRPLASLLLGLGVLAGFAADVGLWFWKGIRAAEISDDVLTVYQGKSLRPVEIRRSIVVRLRVSRMPGSRTVRLRDDVGTAAAHDGERLPAGRVHAISHRAAGVGAFDLRRGCTRASRSC